MYQTKPFLEFQWYDHTIPTKKLCGLAAEFNHFGIRIKPDVPCQYVPYPRYSRTILSIRRTGSAAPQRS